MPDTLATALALPGLGWLIAAAFVAGMVRGFAGFGTALIFLPIAAQVLSPLQAIVVLTIMDLVGPVPNLPRAWRDGHPADVGRLILGAGVVLPFALILLEQLSPEFFRSVVGVLAIAMVVCLLLGLRYRGRLNPPMVYGIGGASGFLGGVAGVPGPPVILLYMASPLAASAIRANTMLFLFAYDVLILGVIGIRGDIVNLLLILGFLLIVPNLLGNLAGAAMFRPGVERFYRSVGYAIIVGAALSGLPIWG